MCNTVDIAAAEEHDAGRHLYDLMLGKFPFEDLFHECYVSHEMGCRKPNLDIYEQLIEKSGITPERAIFIDDTFLNIEGCEAAGIQGYHLTNGEDIRDILKH